MRTTRTQKLMDQSDPICGGAAIKELSARAATSVADPPSPGPRAGEAQGHRARSHTCRAPAGSSARTYARAKLSLPLRVKRIAGQKERVSELCGRPTSARAEFSFSAPKESSRERRSKSKSASSIARLGAAR